MIPFNDLYVITEYGKAHATAIRGCVTSATTPELLAALSESPDVCGGSGLNPKVVEAVAKAFYEADDTYTEEWEFQAEDVKDWYRDKATAGLRAFLSGGWTEGSDG